MKVVAYANNNYAVNLEIKSKLLVIFFLVKHLILI